MNPRKIPMSELETFGRGTILRTQEVYNTDGFGPSIPSECPAMEP